MDHIGFTTIFWTLLGLYVFYQWDKNKKRARAKTGAETKDGVVNGAATFW